MLQWYYLALISSVLTGAAAIVEKRALKREYASAFSASWMLLIAVVSLVFLPFVNLNFSLATWILIYVTSLLTTITYVFTARVFRHGAISVTSPLNQVLPTLFLVILAFIFLGEKLSTIQYAGIGIIVLGTYLILFEKGRMKDFENSKYKYLILIGGAMSGVVAILFKFLLNYVDPITYMVVSQVFVAADMLVYMNWKYGGLRETVSNMGKYKFEIIIIVLLIVGYRITYYTAASLAQISLAYPLSNTLPVIMSVMSGWLMFKEGNIVNKLLLSAMILLGAYLLIL